MAAWPRKERGSGGGHGSGGDGGGVVRLGFACEGNWSVSSSGCLKNPKEKSDPTVHVVSNAPDQVRFMCIRRLRINPVGPN